MCKQALLEIRLGESWYTMRPDGRRDGNDEA